MKAHWFSVSEVDGPHFFVSCGKKGRPATLGSIQVTMDWKNPTIWDQLLYLVSSLKQTLEFEILISLTLTGTLLLQYKLIGALRARRW